MQVERLRPRIVAVIPAYNEEKTIAKIVLLTKKYVDLVIVGDDGSIDMTAELAKIAGAIVIRNDKNQGKGYTLKRLFEEAIRCKADIVVALDADGQHDPNEIPALIKPIIDGKADIVIGSRYTGKNPVAIPFYRKFGLKIISLFHKPIISNVKDTQSGFRAYSKRALEVLVKEMNVKGYGTETEQLHIAKKHKLKIVEVPVQIRYDVESRSKKNPLAHGIEILSSIVKLVTEERPLLTLGLPGSLLLLTGFTAAIYVVWVFNETRYFSIPATLVSIAFMFTGLLLVIAALILHAIENLREIIARSQH